MVETPTTIEMTRGEVHAILTREAEARLGLSAEDMVSAYERGELPNLGDVADLLALADIVAA